MRCIFAKYYINNLIILVFTILTSSHAFFKTKQGYSLQSYLKNHKTPLKMLFNLKIGFRKSHCLRFTAALLILIMASLKGKAQTGNDTAKTAAAATPAAPSSPLSMPGMDGPLSINPQPLKLDAGIAGHSVYVSGAVSTIVQVQNNVAPGDQSFQSDLSNGQVFIQKIDGVIQYFIEIGAYSLPDLGLPYTRAGVATPLYFGVVPQGYLKIAPTANFSIEAGKLPTLIGAEYTFSFENMNIERGILWNEENAVNRGVQANFKAGPVAFAISWNDGFYSNQYTWAWGSVTYTINGSNTLAFIGGGNTKETRDSSAVTPMVLNNEQIYNLIYTHTMGPWTIEPYLQYTSVPQNPVIKTTENASTFGAALFVNYSAHTYANGATVNLPVRLEYLSSTGNAADGAPNLLYGPGSNAWSITFTPTYQYKSFFIRAELSYVQAANMTSGLGLGPTGTNNSQARFLLETGLLF